ncbi:hypothetical protein [Luteimonas sp. MHLX1A]|uniref:hypothetical protein n=1 Tax=Alterluteimonas muca TaxID=2878684 RepID=UPI001E65D811|nr:hypothetical protein [Luteimonas sp. MHLX1A]MCD9046819.1 hypothetical protein [Luteimonas sp. MHLX1A]
MRNEQDPTRTATTCARGDAVTVTHPAFATIRASRVQGHHRLFGSTIEHQGAVVIELTEACMVESGGRQTVSDGRRTIAKVALSEAQWASFVSRLNMGTGVPCTLERVRDGELQSVAGLPAPESSAERLDSAAQAMLDESQRKQDAAFDAMRSILDDAKIPAKVKQALAAQMDMARDHGQVNRDYHRKVLDETNEQLVADARIEIDAMVSDIVQHLGVSSLQEAAALAHGRRPALAAG